MVFDPNLEIEKIKYETIALIRICREIRAIKYLVDCYDILEMTDKINRPWDTHKGIMFSDNAAMYELECISLSLVSWGDPTPERVKSYCIMVSQLIRFWKLSSQNLLLK